MWRVLSGFNSESIRADRMTGCKQCDKIQKETGDKTRLCIDCEIDYWDTQVNIAMNNIEELKKLKEKKSELSSSKK